MLTLASELDRVCREVSLEGFVHLPLDIHNCAKCGTQHAGKAAHLDAELWGDELDLKLQRRTLLWLAILVLADLKGFAAKKRDSLGSELSKNAVVPTKTFLVAQVVP